MSQAVSDPFWVKLHVISVDKYFCVLYYHYSFIVLSLGISIIVLPAFAFISFNHCISGIYFVLL